MNYSALTRSELQSKLDEHRRAIEELEAELARRRAHPSKAVLEGFTPHKWQTAAFQEWERAGHRGIVEAVTGTGKTALGLMVARQSLNMGGKVLIVVPTVVLLDQWHREASNHLRRRVGRLGGQRKDTLSEYDVIVSTIQSVINSPKVLETRNVTLIADECHRYGAQEWGRVLSPHFSRRLGLTATLERSDDGVSDRLLPYFSRLCYQYGFRQAIADDIVSRFNVILRGVPFTHDESVIYAQQDAIARDTRSRLINSYGLPEKPFGEFITQVNLLSKEEPFSPEGRLASRYLSAFAKRREVTAEASAKFEALQEFVKNVKSARGTLIFTETVAGASRIESLLAAAHVKAKAIDGQTPLTERIRYLRLFREQQVEAIVAPRILDEGVDVPSAELGIIVASSSSRRQMIQRMGRVLRKQPGKKATFVILYVEGTPEDPARGGHEAFLDEILDVADRVEVLPSNAARARSGAAASSAAPSVQAAVPPSGASATVSAICPRCDRPVGSITGIRDSEGNLWHPPCRLSAAVRTRQAPSPAPPVAMRSAPAPAAQSAQTFPPTRSSVIHPASRFFSCPHCKKDVNSTIGFPDERGVLWHPACRLSASLKPSRTAPGAGTKSTQQLGALPVCEVCMKPIGKKKGLLRAGKLFHRICATNLIEGRSADPEAGNAPLSVVPAREPQPPPPQPTVRKRGALPERPGDAGYWD